MVCIYLFGKKQNKQHVFSGCVKGDIGVDGHPVGFLGPYVPEQEIRHRPEDG